MHFTIFYAWQSDRPEKVNKYFIRDAANSAIKAIRADADLELAPSLDHDTKGVPGIPDIPSTICEKIDQCGIFLADMTFSGTSETDGVAKKAKHLPNPNVLIELGYALARVGPKRIIYVMNTGFGPPEELPFDIRVRRHPICYELTDHRSPNRTDVQRALARALEEAVRTVVESGALTAPEKTPQGDAARQILEWRKQSTDQLWAAVLAIREGTPRVLLDLEYVTEEEYADAIKSNPTIKAHLRDLTEDAIARGIFLRGKDKNIEEVRPIVGESLWQLFRGYQNFMGRVCLVVAGLYKLSGPWYRDDLALRLLSEVLTTEQKGQVLKMRIGKLSAVRDHFEARIRGQIRSILPDGTVPE